jgi:predicted transposase YdaD
MQKDQPYDSSLKSFLEGMAAQVIPELLAGAEVEEELNVEVLKPPLRADRVYRIRYKEEKCILQVELETKGDSKIVYRLLEYYGILYRKHRKPIISVVIYPFRTAIPESPLRIVVGSEEVLTFHFYVVALWLLDAQSYVRRRVVSMYALLPTMQGATYDVLKQALDEMKEDHGERRKLAEQILLFDTFLQRTDTVSSEDKHKIEEYMDMFDSLLEESRFVRKKRAEGKVEGKIEGKIEGTMETLRQVIVEFVQTRFPSLTTLAQQQVSHVNEPQRLHELVMQLAVVDGEEAAQKLLKSLNH